MKRLAIIGSSGAGKSTLAIALGEKLSLPVIHLDSYFWQTGWIETLSSDWIEIQKELIKRNCWVIDGNYSSTMDTRLEVADTIIWLDFNHYLCLWRVIKRYWQYAGRVRPDMAAGCPEKLDLEFVQYVWNFPNLHRPKILARLAKYRNSKQIIILQNPHQVLDFVTQTVTLT